MPSIGTLLKYGFLAFWSLRLDCLHSHLVILCLLKFPLAFRFTFAHISAAFFNSNAYKNTHSHVYHVPLVSTAARCYYYQCFLILIGSLDVAFIVIIIISWSFCFFTSTNVDYVCFLSRAAESCTEITNNLSARRRVVQFQLHAEGRVELEKSN